MFNNYQVQLIVIAAKQYKKECRRESLLLAMCQLQMIKMYQSDLSIFQEKEVIDILNEFDAIPLSDIH